MHPAAYTDWNRADFVAKYAPEFHQTSTGIRIIYPHDVVEAKQRINKDMLSVDTDVDHCQNLPQNERDAWKSFLSAWTKFYGDGGYSYWGLGGQMDDCENYEMTLFHWKEKLSSSCTISSPAVKPVPERDKPILPGIDSEVVKWLAIGAIGVGVLWMIGPAIRGGASAVGRSL